MKQIQNFVAPLLFIGLLLSSFSTGSFEQKEVSLSFNFLSHLNSFICLVNNCFLSTTVNFQG